MYDQPIADVLLSRKIQHTFPLKSGTRQDAHPIAFIHCSTWTFSQTIRLEKEDGSPEERRKLICPAYR